VPGRSPLTARRSLLTALGRTTERFDFIVKEASENCEGSGDAELKRLKYVCTNLKGGFVELSAHARFLQGASRRRRPRAPPRAPAFEPHAAASNAQP